MKRIATVLAVFLSLFYLWELCSQYFEVLFFALPPPSKIALCLFVRSATVLDHAASTVKVMVGGFLLALAMAFPLAWTMCLSRQVSMFLQPLFVVIKSIPMFALAPLMVIWFGWSYAALVVPTALMIFIPLTLNIYQGLRSTPQELLDYFYVSHASLTQTLFKLQLPWAAPQIFAGFRIAAAMAGFGAIAGEWAGAQKGLGVLMLESRQSIDLEMTFAALTCLTALSLLVYLMVYLTETVCRIGARKKRQKAFKGLIVVGSLFIALCVYPTNSSPPSSTKAVRLLLDWHPNPNHIPLFVGIEKGFFHKRDIDLKILKSHDSSDAVAYLKGRKTDLIVNHLPHTIRARSLGADLKIIGTLVKEPLNCILYRKNEDINSIDDLNGKIMGYCVSSRGAKVLDVLMGINNIIPTLSHNVSFDLVATLGTHKVDAVYGAYWNIEAAQLKSLGVETGFFNLTELGFPAYPELIINSLNSTSFASENFIRKFQEALQESISYCKIDPDLAFDIYMNANPDKSVSGIKWEKMAWEMTLPILADTQDLDKDLYRNFVQWLVDHDLMSVLPHNEKGYCDF